jgi:hypothetical protein
MRRTHPRRLVGASGRRLNFAGRAPGKNAVPNGKSYWFPAKRFGWGWGPPTAWQGWVVMLLWTAALFGGLFLLRHYPYQPAVSVPFVLAMSGVLTLICYWKGEPTKWRRGDRAE